MAKSDLHVRLKLETADGKTQNLEFTLGDPVTVGASTTANLRVEAADVSSLHCMLKAKDEQLVVVDLGSDDGTFVNGDEISGDWPLNDGDRIEIGDAKLQVSLGAVGEATQVTNVANLTTEVTAQAEIANAPTRVRAVAGKDESPNPPARSKSKGRKAKDTESTSSRKSAGSKSGTSEQASMSKSTSLTKAKSSDLSVSLAEHEQPKGVGHVEVTMLWGGSVMGVQRLAGSGRITIGSGSNSSFRISDPAIPTPEHPLVTLGAQGATIQCTGDMKLRVDNADAAQNQLNLQMGQKATVRVGAIEFVIQYSERYKPIDLGLFQTLDFLYAKVLGVALIFQIALVVAMLITPKFDGDDDDDLFQNPNEFQALILKPEEKKKEKKELSGKKGAKRKDDEGVFGKKDKPKEDKLASKKGAPKVDKDKREEDRKLAMDALAALGLKGPDGAVSNVLGPGGLGSGINNALGGLRGASMGDAGGAGGLGSRGTGAGGGGNALGIGGLGSGTGRGSGGSGGIDLGGRGKGMTRVQPGKVISKGSLSREEIQRVIRRVMNQIKFCYERELNKNPNLEGKIVASWVIQGSGDVGTAKASQNTMGNANVEECVMRIIKRLRFPQPQGGGQVFVTYPFVFSPSG